MNRTFFAEKRAGLLVPVFALRRDGDFGIGDTRAVREAVDFCHAEGFSVLQTLPIHETIGDHSPYNAVSSVALSPALLELSEQAVPGLVAAECVAAAPEPWLARLRQGPVKHGSVQPLKRHILQAAFRAFRAQFAADSPLRREFAGFQAEQAWLPAYTLFRLLVGEYEGNPNWQEWRPEHQTLGDAEAWFSRHPDHALLAHRREGHAFVQWVAWRQWREVRAHADERGVKLMGEMSFGVGRSSADVWSQPELFDPDWNMGTRPISYFDTNKDSERWGQNWGLPAYRWENHRSTDFAWLRRRVATERQFFHVCRIDHLRGYFRGYMFPWPGGATHAEFAQLSEEQVRQHTGGRMPRFVPGPDDNPATARMNDLQGREIVGVMKEAAGDMSFVAEIMGNMPDYMRLTLDELEIPSLTFPQLERNPDGSLQAIETLRPLSLASFANHDHAPLAAHYQQWWEAWKKGAGPGGGSELERILRHVGWEGPPPPTFTDELLAAFQATLFRTPCFLAVLMSSDLLGIAQRFNLPGSYGAETWNQRLELPLAEYSRHPVYGPRLEQVRRLIVESGRGPDARIGNPETEPAAAPA